MFDPGALQNFGAGAILLAAALARRTPVRPQIQGAISRDPAEHPAGNGCKRGSGKGGKATTIQSPYTGECCRTPARGSADAPAVADQQSRRGGRTAGDLCQPAGRHVCIDDESVLQNIFQQNGGARTVTVQGVISMATICVRSITELRK